MTFKEKLINNKEKIMIALLVKMLIILMIPLAWNFHLGLKDTEEHQIVEDAPEDFIPIFANIHELQGLEQIKMYVFYVDEGAYVLEEELDLQKLANLDLSLNLRGQSPRVLITHSHAQEGFEGGGNVKEVGRLLAEILVNDFGISTVHDIATYDIIEGELKREGAYERMEQGVSAILEKHPSIEVIIDLHRDQAPEDVRLVQEIAGNDVARLMFFNGISRRNVDGEPQDLNDLYNPYQMENLALSLQLFLTANERHPGLMRRNYIKAYRYSLHMVPRSVLVEVGGHTNTLEEAKNAMPILANLLVEVLGP
ncbi:MAG: stage II sporulation protein P [Defluviitaleaceae bacterium]|nr:stage II sporulation protein P [Defluviitaleaceae bacterium]